MNKLFVYLKEYKKETILGPLFKLLEASFELFVPLVVASMIDVGIKTGDTGYIIRMCLVLVALGVIGLVCSITAQYFAAKAAVGFVKKIRHALFRHIQSLSYTELDTLGASTMITRMTSDVNQVQNGTNLTLRLLLRSPFVVFGAMVMAFTIDWKAAMVFVVTIPLLCIVVFGIMLVSIPLYRKVQARLDRLLGITRENLTGVRVLRAFCKENEEIAEFEERNEALTGVQKFVGRISALMNPVTYIIINLAVVALIWTGAIRVEAGILTQGMVIALYNYMSQILTELVKMANLIINITKAVACGNRIASVFEITSSQQQASASPEKPESAPEVEFRNVSLQYKGAGEDSLSGLSFSVRPGETIGVIGGTGSGKTSLVNLIPRFYDATGGEVLVRGANVQSYPLEELRSMIGVVPQKAVLFQGTVRENLKWGNPDATDDELWDALASAQAQEVVESKKGGLDFEIEQAGRNLSGGQRQRLTIARALVRRPRILILDDSSSALDFATDAALRKSIRELPYSPTVFLVSQRASSIQYADKIIVLDDGEAVGIGTHEELLRDCAVYQEIYNSQFRKEDA
ncbi:MAG: ATP-binding protein [Clostridiales bacterium]|nr:ABC transporter ATP-binding protein [Clostridiales bacterium]PWM42050.1 MAG: ATP-binding protein [Clostridiales bacterium]